MALMLIADSQVQRIWNQVRANRELLRTSTYVLVKNIEHVSAAYQSIKPSVSMPLLVSSLKMIYLCGIKHQFIH